MSEQVLIVGSGGREAAIQQAILDTSPEVERVDLCDDPSQGLSEFGGGKKPFVIIGPERYLVAGLADDLRNDGYVVLGVGKKAAEYEASKAKGVELAISAGVPVPESYTSIDIDSDREFILNNNPWEYVIKADGLADGKGVFLPKSYGESEGIVSDLRSGRIANGAGKEKIVYARRYHGAELSATALVGGNENDFLMLPLVQDHKKLKEGDLGPNTGGMGAYGPVPPEIVDGEKTTKIDNLIYNSLAAAKREGIDYSRGLMFPGLMLARENNENPVLLEYGVRFGDPEAQVLMAILKSAGVNVYRLLRSAAEGQVEPPDIDFSELAISAMTVCLASKGYPGDLVTGDRIWGLENEYPGVTIQKAAVEYHNRIPRTAGGRVLWLTGVGRTIDEAAKYIYSAIDMKGLGAESEKISFKEMQFRKDIASRVRITYDVAH